MAGEYSPARPFGSSKTWLGSIPWLTTSSSYATNSMAGNSLATLPISGWGAWVRVVCWVGSVGAAGQPRPVGRCTLPAGLRRGCRRLQHLRPLGLRSPGSSGCCGLRVGSRPGVREANEGRGGDKEREEGGGEGRRTAGQADIVQEVVGFASSLFRQNLMQRCLAPRHHLVMQRRRLASRSCQETTLV